jgi:hypothetical protein
MDTVSTSTGSSSAADNDQRLQQELDQAHLRQAQIYSQLQAQLLKQSKGPSGFRKVLGVVAGAAAGVFAPGLGNAVGSMVIGNSQSNSLNNLATLNAMNTFAANGGLAESSSFADASAATAARAKASLQQTFTDSQERVNQELDELAKLPKGPDPIAYLALAEKTNAEAEVFQATTAIAKAKHQAAMAAIQNIKD